MPKPSAVGTTVPSHIERPPAATLPPTPAPLGRAVATIAAAFGMGLACTGWIEAKLDEPLRGRLVAHEATIHAPSEGRLAEWNPADGAAVRHGSRLGLVEDVALGARTDERRRDVTRLTAELDRTRARVDVELAWRLKEIDTEILTTELRSADLLRQRLDERLGDLAWSEFSAREGNVTPAIVPFAFDDAPTKGHAQVLALLKRERARNATEVVDAQLELCERRLGELRGLRTSLREEVSRAHGVDSLSAELERSRTELARLEAAAATLVVRAPSFGRVDRVEFTAGDDVQRGDALAIVVDRDRPGIEVPVPSSRIEAFAPETPIRLRFPGGEKRTGIVTGVPPRAVVRRNDRDDPAAETYVLVRVEPMGKLWPTIPLGATVEVRSGD